MPAPKLRLLRNSAYWLWHTPCLIIKNLDAWFLATVILSEQSAWTILRTRCRHMTERSNSGLSAKTPLLSPQGLDRSPGNLRNLRFTAARALFRQNAMQFRTPVPVTWFFFEPYFSIPLGAHFAFSAR